VNTTLLIKHFRSLVICFLCVTWVASNGQTFSYGGAKCANEGTFGVSPPQLPSGGTFNAPAGLTINPLTGVITVSASTTGFYTITYTGSTCNCVYTATFQINPAPVISITNNTMCAGAASMKMVAMPGGLTYTWLPTGTNGQTLTVPSSVAGNSYTVIATNSSGCKGTAVASGTIYGTTPLQITGSNSLCAGGTVVLVGSGTTKPRWNTGATTNTIQINPTSNTTYTLFSDEAPLCNFKTTKSVQVFPRPLLTVQNYSACSGTTLKIGASALPADNIKWTWQPSIPFPADTIVLNAVADTKYTVTGTRSGCASSATINVSVFQSTTPVASFFYKSPVCVNSFDSLPEFSPGFTGGGHFSSFPPVPMDTITGRLDMAILQEGAYTVTYTIPKSGCRLEAKSVNVLIVSRPGAISTSGDVRINTGESATLTAEGGTSYLWTPSDYLSCTTCPNPVASPPASRIYCVASFAGGCYAESCLEVVIKCDVGSDLTVPNAFTPNKDGLNDTYFLKGWSGCNTGFNIVIFDRWGEKVFESSKPDFIWDGTFNGQPLIAGVYAYIITASFNKEPSFVKTGSITMVK
jgi:gliding motility-associated-like protein